MATPVSIIIPAFNQLAYCQQCIDSIRANTRHPHRLILVDNGSTDGVAEYFDAVPEALALHAPRNLGFPAGVNLGLARAEGHVLLLNSDTLVPEGWLDRLITALESADDMGMVGPRSNYVSGEQLIPELLRMPPEETDRVARDRAVRYAGQHTPTDRLVGFCLLIREAAWRGVGPLDESFGIGNYEDDDYCLRVRAAGYRLCIAEDAFVFHYGSRTFAGLGLTGDRLNALLAENEAKLKEKWALELNRPSQDLERSRALNAKASHAFKEGDIRAALELLAQAIQACACDEMNYNDLGAVLWQLGEHDRAIRNFARALQLNPALEAARENLRNAAQALGRLDEFRDLLAERPPEP